MYVVVRSYRSCCSCFNIHGGTLFVKFNCRHHRNVPETEPLLARILPTWCMPSNESASLAGGTHPDAIFAWHKSTCLRRLHVCLQVIRQAPSQFLALSPVLLFLLLASRASVCPTLALEIVAAETAHVKNHLLHNVLLMFLEYGFRYDHLYYNNKTI